MTLAREGAKNNIKVNSLGPNALTRLSSTLPDAFGRDTRGFTDPADSIAPLVTYLAHESQPNTGHFFECGAGWIARTRLQRSKGVEFRPDPAVFTPASIKAKIDEIMDFKDAVVPELVQAGPGGEDTMTRLQRVLKLPPVEKGEELSFEGRVVVVTGGGAGLGRASVQKQAAVHPRNERLTHRRWIVSQLLPHVRQGGGEGRCQRWVADKRRGKHFY